VGLYIKKAPKVAKLDWQQQLARGERFSKGKQKMITFYEEKKAGLRKTPKARGDV